MIKLCLDEFVKKIEKTGSEWNRIYHEDIVYSILGLMYYSFGLQKIDLLRTWLISNVNDDWFRGIFANNYPKPYELYSDQILDVESFINKYNTNLNSKDLIITSILDEYIEYLRYNKTTQHVSSIFVGTLSDKNKDKNRFEYNIMQRFRGGGFYKGPKGEKNVAESPFPYNPIFSLIISVIIVLYNISP